MFTVNIKGKVNAKGEKSVKLEMIFFLTGYPRASKVLNITGPIKDWNNQTQSFNSSGSEAVAKNKLLFDLKMKYLNVAEQWEAEGKVWSPVQWSHCFDQQQAKKSEQKAMSVLQMIDFLQEKFLKKERIKNGVVISSYSNSKQYEWMRKSLCEFTKQTYNRSLSSFFFQDITETFILDYTLFTKKQGLANGNKSGLTLKLRRLRAICNYAKKIGIYDFDINIFDCVGQNIKWNKTESRAVSRETMTLVENFDRSLLTPKESFYLDLFLFSYYCGGMANVDVCNLNWDSVQENNIVYERIKFPKTAKPILIDKCNIYKDTHKI